MGIASTSGKLYEVKEQSSRKVVFSSTSKVKSEFVGIALALSCLYGSREVYQLQKGGVTLVTYEPETAFAFMQGKMRQLIYNKRITVNMPFVPDRFTDMTESRIVKMAKTEKGRDKILDKVTEITEEYLDYVEDNLADS